MTLTLLFQDFVLLSQVINVLLVRGIFLPHRLNVLSGLFEDLCTRCLKQR